MMPVKRRVVVEGVGESRGATTEGVAWVRGSRGEGEGSRGVGEEGSSEEVGCSDKVFWGERELCEGVGAVRTAWDRQALRENRTSNLQKRRTKDLGVGANEFAALAG
jgi:hypothetical protein